MQQDIETFVKNLKFKKKSIGGCDEEDVLIKMSELSNLYREEFNLLKQEVTDKDNLISQLQAQIQIQAQTQADLEAKVQMKAQNVTARVVDNSNDEYLKRINQMDRLMQTLQASKNEILQRTKLEAQQEADKLRREVANLQRVKEALASDIKNQSSLMLSQINEIGQAVDYLRGQIERFIVNPDTEGE